MKKYSKNILFLLLIIILSMSIIACENGDVDYTNIKGSMGLLEDLVEKDDALETIFKLPNGETLKLSAAEDFLESLTIGEHYTFAYKEDIHQIIAFDYIEVKETETDDNLDDNSKSIPITNGKVDVEELTLVDTVETVVTNSDREDIINLYTSAELHESGELMLDDGQTWKLIVHTPDGDFVLFDEYVQGSPLDLYVFTEDEDLKIATIQSGTANLTLTEYQYDSASKTFKSTIGYNAMNNINMIYMR